MDVWRITVATLRRWYVFLPLLALTGWAVLVVGNGVSPEYEVQASAMITPNREEGAIPNPYDTISQATAAVAIVLNSPEARDRVGERGLISSYEVSSLQRSTIMKVSVRGDTEEGALATGDAVLQMIHDELSQRQTAAGLAPDAQYGMDILVQPAVIEVIRDGALRVQAVVGLLGASVALVIAVLFDDIVGLIRQRRRRSSAARAPSTGAAGGAAHGVPTGADQGGDAGDPSDGVEGGPASWSGNERSDRAREPVGPGRTTGGAGGR